MATSFFIFVKIQYYLIQSQFQNQKKIKNLDIRAYLVLYIVSYTERRFLSVLYFMKCSITEIFIPNYYYRLSRPLVASRVSAGFPSPAEDYIEGRIDLNRDLIPHPFTTFYVRVIGDSMESLICSGEMLIVDRMPETKDKDIVIARLGNELCVKRLRILDDGSVWLFSENSNYKPIEVTLETDFEIWGKVLHSIQSFK